MRSTPVQSARDRPSRFGPAKSLLSIALLAGMAGVVFPGVDAIVSHSRNELAITELLLITESFHQHRQDEERWPSASHTPTVVTQRLGLAAYPSLFAESDDLAAITDLTTDPWGAPYLVCSFAQGFDGTRGGLVLLSAGPDGQVQSDDKQVFNAQPAADDLTQLITFNLR